MFNFSVFLIFLFFFSSLSPKKKTDFSPTIKVDSGAKIVAGGNIQFGGDLITDDEDAFCGDYTDFDDCVIEDSNSRIRIKGKIKSLGNRDSEIILDKFKLFCRESGFVKKK